MNEQVDQLVAQYQRGDEEAAYTLLVMYGGEDGTSQFLGKYLKLLKREVFDLTDKDTRRFLQLYMVEGREALVNRHQSKEGKAAAAKTASMLAKGLAQYDEMDLIQDLQMLFLQQAMRYRKQKKHVNFSGYLYNSFRFAVFNYLKKTVFKYDVLNHPYIEQLDEELVGEEGIEIKDEWFYEDRFFDQEGEELGLDWVNGGRCNEAFENLTQLERLILKLAYEDNKTDTEIAEHLGFHRNTILKYRHEAKQRLQETLEALKKDDVFF